VDTYAEIIVGTDGGPDATCAVRVAGSLAGQLGLPLRIVNAWTDSGPDAYLAASEVTERAEAVAREAGAGDVSRLEPGATGTPADALLDLVAASAEDDTEVLLVVGDRGLDSGGERFGGSTARQLTHHSPVDVLVVLADRAPGLRSIATTTDGSLTATRGVYRGVALAQALGIVPDILTVARTEGEGAAALSVVSDDLTLRGIAFTTRTLIASGRADVARALVEAADGYDLLVIGNRGMSGPSRLLGSVSGRVSHAVGTNLLVVRTVI
jgi:nucleotide-binding universal stress UspA family protein